MGTSECNAGGTPAMDRGLVTSCSSHNGDKLSSSLMSHLARMQTLSWVGRCLLAVDRHVATHSCCTLCALTCSWEIEVSALHILYTLASRSVPFSVLITVSTFALPQVKTLHRLEEDFKPKRNFSRICTSIRPSLKLL